MENNFERFFNSTLEVKKEKLKRKFYIVWIEKLLVSISVCQFVSFSTLHIKNYKKLKSWVGLRELTKSIDIKIQKLGVTWYKWAPSFPPPLFVLKKIYIILCLSDIAHQTHYTIIFYRVSIIFYLYLVSYFILSLYYVGRHSSDGRSRYLFVIIIENSFKCYRTKHSY